MSVEQLASIARRRGRGYPLLIVDLAAVDQNIGVVTSFAREQGWGVRPALKTFRSPKLIRYILRRLPEPRGLYFNLSDVDPLLRIGPRRLDLMGGYPPTFGELADFLARPGTRPRGRQRVRLLIDSVPLLEELARLARSSRRALPLDVALELDVGMGRGGINDRDELAACIEILRAERPRLRLGAVLGYDGHATLNGDATYRRLVATQARSAYRAHLANLAELGGDLYDRSALIRNGPGSSNYRNWVGGPINEISPGSAFLLAAYLEDGFDTEGLAAALTMGGAVRRITSDHPSVPLTGTTPPGAGEEEIIVQAIGDPGEVIHPDGAREDHLSGGGDALVVPKGSVELGDYVLYRPIQTEVAIVRFAAIAAYRDGRFRRRWPTETRPGRSAILRR